MTLIKLNIRKSLEKNAETYFERAKKMRAKIDGIKRTIQKFEKQILVLEKEEKTKIEEEQKKAEKKTVEKKWFEKFHWFISSEGILCIGGRDATTNEIIIKKHLDKEDIVFHTEAAGSPFFVTKNEGKKIGEATIKECAQATTAYSKAWKLGLATTDVYWVTPEQISKTAESGEHVPKGAFMIRGKKNNVPVEIKLAVGVMDDNKIMGGPVNAIIQNCKKYALVEQGDDKTSDCAKKIQKILGTGDITEIISVLPAGGCIVRKP